MKLPNVDRVIVSRPKLAEYLLSPGHPEGGSKAAFFLRFGFTADAWEELAWALLVHAATHEVTEVADTEFGRHYVVEGRLQALDGRLPAVRVVWFIGHGEEYPRLATAYPLGR